MPTFPCPRFLLLSSLALTLTGAACAGQSGYAPSTIATESAAGDRLLAPTATAGAATTIGTPAPRPDERPGLATAWGESVWSPITMQPFVRAAAQPWAAAVIHYNDADGVRAHAAYLGAAVGPLETWVGDGALAVAIVDDAGAILPGLAAGGRNLVAAVDGQRYQIVIRNATSARFEVVTSVDGLDVIDGKPAGVDRRGYLVEPQGQLVIDGFRRSDDQVAAFRFGKVASSYAAATSGDANVGVIGVALFAERGATWTRAELGRRDQANPFPSRSYATSP